MEHYTSDLFFAAFLKLKGYEIEDFQVISKGRGKYKFKMTEDEYKKQKIEFVKSDISKVKQHIEELKDLVW